MALATIATTLLMGSPARAADDHASDAAHTGGASDAGDTGDTGNAEGETQQAHKPAVSRGVLIYGGAGLFIASYVIPAALTASAYRTDEGKVPLRGFVPIVGTWLLLASWHHIDKRTLITNRLVRCDESGDPCWVPCWLRSCPASSSWASC